MTRPFLLAALVPFLLAPFLLATAAQAQQKSPCLESAGALAASQIYTFHAYIGTVGDAFVSKTYTAKKTRALMKELSGMSQNVSKYIGAVAGSEITPDDRKFLQEIVAILALHRQQADALYRYAGTGAKADADAYEAARKAAWSRIKTLLNLK